MSERAFTTLVLLLATLFSILVGMILPPAARGQTGHHGHGHSERHDWYFHLKQPGTNASCCTRLTEDGKSGDCRPVRAWLDDDGTWIAVVDGQQKRVPEHVIIRTPGANKEPIYAHACVGYGGLWWCFLPAGPGG
ncbi:MAG TPA: hypothetical protein VEC14_07845 [Reyranellaceae bacterium]|nr:hypothetical protein [Reyranellaceae bacterium]